jgi:hypothetical protein
MYDVVLPPISFALLSCMYRKKYVQPSTPLRHGAPFHVHEAFMIHEYWVLSKLDSLGALPPSHVVGRILNFTAVLSGN